MGEVLRIYNEDAMAARIQLSFVILAVCALAFVALPAHAQFGLTDVGNALTIGFSPATPGPGDTVNLSVQSSLIDIQESDILWQANGKTVAQGKGVDSTKVA